MPEAAVKPGRHREASLYHALHGAGAGDGRSLAQLREAALSAYEELELPVWRRSGFWTTSLQTLDLDALSTQSGDPQSGDPKSGDPKSGDPHAGGVPEVVERTLPDRARAGRIVQNAGTVVHVELDSELAERGVILCSLEDAFRKHPGLVEPHYSMRLTIDRHKLEAANAAFWTGGAFLYVPPGVVVEDPFEIVYAIDRAGVAQYGRTLIVGDRSSELRVHEYDLAEDFDGQALHAGALELLPARRRALLAWPRSRIGAPARCTTCRRDSSASGATPTATGCPRCWAAIWCASIWSWPYRSPAGTWRFVGCSSPRQTSIWMCSRWTCTRPDLRAETCTGAGRRPVRAGPSFEGLIQIDPGAQQTHTYLQIHTMMLSPKARLDAIPSVLVSADDVSASHGGTVGELDESAIFYMQSRGLDRPAAVRVLVEGFFEPVLAELHDEPLEELIRAKLAAKLAHAREDIEAYAVSR